MPSWARMMITFAPSVMSCSTSVACFSADEPASVPTYEPPAPSTTSLMLGSSHLAQRSSLKLFQDTPTLQSAAAALPDALAAGSLAVGALAAALGAVEAPPPDEQAARSRTALNESAATLRMDIV